MTTQKIKEARVTLANARKALSELEAVAQEDERVSPREDGLFDFVSDDLTLRGITLSETIEAVAL